MISNLKKKILVHRLFLRMFFIIIIIIIPIFHLFCSNSENKEITFLANILLPEAAIHKLFIFSHLCIVFFFSWKKANFQNLNFMDLHIFKVY